MLLGASLAALPAVGKRFPAAVQRERQRSGRADPETSSTGMTRRSRRGKTAPTVRERKPPCWKRRKAKATPKASTPTIGRTPICASSSRGRSAPARSPASRARDWRLEMGTLAEIVNHARPEPPAILFEDVPGYPSGMRLLSGATNSSKRLAITLGLPVPGHPLDVVRAYRDRMKTHRPIPPKTRRERPGARERRSRRQGRHAEISRCRSCTSTTAAAISAPTIS